MTRIAQCQYCPATFVFDKVRGRLPTRCETCRLQFNAARQRQWREANPERAREIYQKNNVKRLADPEFRRRKREAEVARNYGITPEEFRALEAAQGGLCAICQQPPRGKSPGKAYAGEPRRDATLHVDHCHTSGRVRGLLCGNCNTMIGLAGEDSKVLLAAVEYLEKG
jgi:hypothetical protein